MRSLALILILAISLASSSAFAATITVHSSPSFTIDTVNLFASAHQYPSEADAIAAATSFLADGAPDSGWGTGAFGGVQGFQAQYLYFAYESGSGSDRGVLLASRGDQPPFSPIRSGPKAASKPSRQKQIPSSNKLLPETIPQDSQPI